MGDRAGLKLLGFLLLAWVAAFGSLAHAQRVPEVAQELLLEIDGDQLLQSELEAAAEKVREALKSIPSSGQNWAPVTTVERIAIEGDAVLVKLRTSEHLASAIERIKSVLGGYDVQLLINGNIEAKMSLATLAKRINMAGGIAQQVASRRLSAAGYPDAVVERDGPARLRVKIPRIGIDRTRELPLLLIPAGRLSFHMVDVSVNPADYVPRVPKNGRVALLDISSDRMRSSK